jgi:hypothetical protein
VTESEGDAAALRRAFDKAAETFPGSVTKFLDDRGPSGKAEAEKLMAWWAEFYEAVRDHAAGMSLLAELQKAKDAAPPAPPFRGVLPGNASL